MPEETIKEMVDLMESGNTSDALNAAQRPRSNSDSAAATTQAAQKPGAGINITKDTDLELMEYFMEIVTANERTMTFFANMPASTYQQSQFTDWIADFLGAVGMHIVANKGDSKLSKDTIESYQELNSMLMTKYVPFLMNWGKEMKQKSKQRELLMSGQDA